MLMLMLLRTLVRLLGAQHTQNWPIYIGQFYYFSSLPGASNATEQLALKGIAGGGAVLSGFGLQRTQMQTTAGFQVQSIYSNLKFPQNGGSKQGLKQNGF